MRSYLHYIIQILRKIIILLFIYECSRLLFYLVNLQYFTSLSSNDVFRSFFFGLRFDLSALLMLNAPFILLLLLPFHFRSKKAFTKYSNLFFYISNSIGIFFNCIDAAYFPFTLKRTTGDVFSFVSTGNDFLKLLPNYMQDFWYVFLLAFVLIAGMIVLDRFLPFKKFNVAPAKNKIKYFGFHLLMLVFVITLSIIGMRGGFQLRPISILTAAEYTDPAGIPLTLNTPFTIIKTYGKRELNEVNYFPPTVAHRLFSPEKSYISDTIPRKDNVVIIIMESFSSEYTAMAGAGKKSYTPFFDSLSNEGLLFTHAFANGRKSMEALPAILASMPSLMNNPYITSEFAANRLHGLPAILREMNYNTSFFHGGTNGTMGFDAFSKAAGIENYYGKSQYGNEDFDGKWGVYDEPYFQYFAKNLNSFPQPFFSVFFSLSSHHPYSIPEKYKNKFPKGTLPIHESIGYADFSLGKFFEFAKKQSWFKNTLFIITADHAAESAGGYYSTRAGSYAIPLLFYKTGSEMKGRSEVVAQQCDIMPSVLDYLWCNKKFISYGNSVFGENEKHFAINFLNDTYQFISDDYGFILSGATTAGVYNLKLDSLQNKNLSLQKDVFISDKINLLKAIIQSYNHRMITNRLCP
ncbi:MAG: sulfatase-like hydrolase/transferase [Bacteroidota bacterium]